MKALVTGAAGFIGSAVTRLLVGRGDEVLAMVRPGSARFRLGEWSPRIAEATLEDEERIARILADFRPDTVFHLAWYARPGDYLTSEENLQSLAVTASFARHAFAAGCPKFVGVGSCAEYASSPTPRREPDASEPRTLYGACKRAAALVVGSLAAAARAEMAWARVFHVHGRGEDPARLLPKVAEALAAGRPVELSPGDQVRDHLHVEDVASALVHLARPGYAGAFNVCSGNGVTLREVLTTLAETMGRPDLLRFGARPYASAEEHYLVGDPSRLRETGWTPAWPDLRAGLADAVASYRSAVPR